MEKYLSDCVKSLYRQNLNFSQFEVIVVNDESSDRTLEIALGFEKQYSNLLVVDKKNGGVGSARNAGFDVSKGKYMFFLDPDDYIADNVMDSLLRLAQFNNLDILSFESMDVKHFRNIPSRNLSDYYSISDLPVFDGISQIANRKYRSECWWYIIKSSFLKQEGIRFLEGRWMEDVILTAETFVSVKRIAHIDLDVHRYRILPTSAMRNKSSEHYKKLIFDIGNAAHVFVDLLNELPKNHIKFEQCYNRLKTRQQSFVFFLLVRLMKSDMNLNLVPKALEDYRKIDAYPLNRFISEDYDGPFYRFLVFVFNKPKLIVPFMRFFRFFYRVAT